MKMWCLIVLLPVVSASPLGQETQTVSKTPAPTAQEPMGFSSIQRGSKYTRNFRVFNRMNGQIINPWHDCPLWFNEEKLIINMVVGMPRWENARFRMNIRQPLAPVQQDTRVIHNNDVMDDGLRYYLHTFPFLSYSGNSATICQTWLNPNFTDPDLGTVGEHWALAVVDFGQRIPEPGEILQAKVLGVWPTVDMGLTDWKLVVLNANDPDADRINSLEDLEDIRPGFLKLVADFLSAGNSFPMGRLAMGKTKAKEVIERYHAQWKAFFAQAGPLTLNTMHEGHPQRIGQEQAMRIVEQFPPPAPPAPKPEKSQYWTFTKAELVDEAL